MFNKPRSLLLNVRWIMTKYPRTISPPVHRGMMDLDRTAFTNKINVLAARVPPTKVQSFMNANIMKGEILELPKVASVVRELNQQEGNRLVLLGSPNQEEIPQPVREFIDSESLGLTNHELTFDYDYWSLDEIMRSVLPEDLGTDSPSSFTITGHIAHFNLRDQYLPYKHLIGQVVLDKNKRIRTVVNKLGTIHAEFRYFDMEVLAGEKDFNVTLSESDCTFQFDFSTVYWNSRLQSEHLRLIESFKPGQVIADVCAGVGPFALPAAKRRSCFVLGNDLNPSCAEAMKSNGERNKVSDWLRVSCQDGRHFIRQSVLDIYNNPFPPRPAPLPPKPKTKPNTKPNVKTSSQASTQQPPPPPSPDLPSRQRVDHFVMNLPATAIEFLDAFRGILSDPDIQRLYENEGMPMVHCYSFTKELDPEKAKEDLLARGSNYLGAPITEDVNCHWVRTVAPNKDMYCLSFRLPRDIATSIAPI